MNGVDITYQADGAVASLSKLAASNLDAADIFTDEHSVAAHRIKKTILNCTVLGAFYEYSASTNDRPVAP